MERREGKLKRSKDATIVDPPGIYSLSSYILEKVAARNYLITEYPDAILNTVDGINLGWSPYLTIQLMKLGTPVLIAVSMMDVVEESGDQISIQALSRELGCPAVGIFALKDTDIMETVNKAAEPTKDSRATTAIHKSSVNMGTALEEIEQCIGGNVPEVRKRFYAIRPSERDDKITVQTTVVPDAGSIIARMEDTTNDNAESIVTNERYTYITSTIGRCYTKKNREKTSVSDGIDHIVVNRFLALPISVAVMRVVYYISTTTVDTQVTDWANDGVFGEGWNLLGLEVPGVPIIVERFLVAVGCADRLSSLILDGAVAGVGAVPGFMSQMLVLFIFFIFLEPCGYMARVAFIMDRVFRKLGLSGESFIPMLIRADCDVSDIMASRTIKNDRGRKMTIIATIFIPCGIKLPIIALPAGTLFGGASWVAPSVYLMGIAAIICSGVILKKVGMFAGDPAPFVTELPACHLPTVSNVLCSMRERG